MKKNLLSIGDLTQQEIFQLIELATKLKKKPIQSLLTGKTLGILFTKSSTRTRVSFEVGIFQLGGYAIFLEPQTLQLQRGETIEDTVRVLSRYLNAIVVRTYEHDELKAIAQASDIPVINGLTDRFHPCQVLSDLLTIKEKRGTLEDLHVIFVGDGCNNIAHSWLMASALLGIQLTVASPPAYWPDSEIVRNAVKLSSQGSSFFQATSDLEGSIKDADVVYTDVWVSMGQEQEREKRLKDLAPYQLNAKLLSQAKKDVLVMHCLPAHRGEEITDEILDGPNSIIYDQAENRLHMQKAIMLELMGDWQAMKQQKEL
ncbi:MAG: ornithine carbamoyltransferase [Chlamydiota bacterium]|nr:ornithine carbamoyltransferase [Chlamydiota bacterium]